jgi:hypothetical protein
VFAGHQRPGSGGQRRAKVTTAGAREKPTERSLVGGRGGLARDDQ